MGMQKLFRCVFVNGDLQYLDLEGNESKYKIRSCTYSSLEKQVKKCQKYLESLNSKNSLVVISMEVGDVRKYDR